MSWNIFSSLFGDSNKNIAAAGGGGGGGGGGFGGGAGGAGGSVHINEAPNKQLFVWGLLIGFVTGVLFMIYLLPIEVRESITDAEPPLVHTIN